ncbi:MAG: SUMF1/EgtB/PvdO family nonheme iron enzyme [Acidobacteriota bacterium]
MASERLHEAMRDHYTRYPRTVLWLVPGGDLERPVGEPRSIEPFYLSKVPITNEQFEAFDPGFERSPWAPDDRDPALGVSWQDAAEYCTWYAEIARKPMRLASEAEWEYACRGGLVGQRFQTGDDSEEAGRHQWDADNSEGRLHPLDDRKANGFGLFGMLGGAWEWVAAEAEDDPVRVLRGGSFRTPRAGISCALRRKEGAEVAVPDAGFRVAKSLRR